MKISFTLSFLLILISTSISFSQLSGSYTIGGSSPDYSNILTAVTDLTTNGVSNPVTFNIRDGIYNQQVSIGYIQGTSALNTVTFTSESNDNTAVVWTYTPTSSNNYTCQLYGCDYLIFDKITLKAIGTSYSKVVSIINSSSNNTFSDCIIEGSTTSSSDQDISVIHEGSGSNENNVFVGNTILNGSYGIYYQNGDNIVIENNNFENQYRNAVNLRYLNGVSVIGNQTSSNTLYTSYCALYFAYCDNDISIQKNKIDLTNGYYGIQLYYCDGSSTNRGLIANNFVHIGGTSSYDVAHGITLYYSSYQNIYYNSVNVTRTYSECSAFLQSSSSNGLRLQNNCFANNGGGYAIYVSTPSSINVSDYNNLFTTGTNLGRWSSTTCNSLSSWQTNSGKDLNSVSINPEYVSNTDLHTQAYLLDNLGYAVTEVSDDIDNNARDLLTPDMGANEWTTPVNDAGILSIDESMTYCIDNDYVYTTIKNFGTTILTSATIAWEVNGVSQTSYNWTGSLVQGNEDVSVNIGYFNFDLGTQYSVKAWTTSPNGGTEGFNHNDTSEINNIYQAMSGTYTIGGTSPNYATIQDAVTDLENGGVCNPVTFNIRDGIYNQQVSIGYIQGTSALNTVTFTSESNDNTAVVWTYTPTSSNNYTCQLYGCDYLIFDKITLKAIGTSYSKVVSIINSSSNNTFSDCIIEGSTTSSSDQDISVIHEGSGSNENNVFVGNTILNGSYGIYYQNGDNIVIENNNFENQYRNAVNLRYLNGVSVIGNQTSSNTLYTSYCALYFAYCDNDISIQKNKIDLTNGYYGIQLYYCDGSSTNRGLIANNFVHIGGTSSYDVAHGITLYYSSYQNIYYNSVNVTRTYSECSAFLQSSSSNGLRLQNNCFANNGGGYAIYVSTPSSINVSDYNNLFTTGTNLGRWSSTTCNSLSSWQTNSGKDLNSVSINPEYVSNTDLHICEPLLNNVAYPVSEVIADIDGQLRDLVTPDIGADEFNSLLSVNLPENITACGSTIIDAGNPGSAFLWSTGETTQTIEITTSGVFWVEATNACGISIDTVSVTILSELLLDLGSDTVVCGGSPIILDASNSGALYYWSNGTNSQTLNILAPGIYWVEVVLGACAVSDTINITFSTSPTSIFTVDNMVCENEDATITYAGTGTSSAVYTWDFDGATASPNGQGPHVVNWNTSGTKTISLSVEENGCISTQTTMPVNVNDSPDMPTITQVANTLASSSSSNNQWYFNGIIITGATLQFYTVTQSGFYQVEVTNIYDCSVLSEMFNVDIISIEENENNEDIRIYPNPTTGIFTLESKGINKITIVDITGKLVYSELGFNKDTLIIDLNHHAKGLYIVKVYRADDVVVLRVIHE